MSRFFATSSVQGSLKITPPAPSAVPYRGTSLIRKATPEDPILGLRLGPYGGPMGGAVSYERGTPVVVALTSIPLCNTHASAIVWESYRFYLTAGRRPQPSTLNPRPSDTNLIPKPQPLHPESRVQGPYGGPRGGGSFL